MIQPLSHSDTADHPNTASSLDNLADCYWEQERYTEAKTLWERALSIYQQRLGAQHQATLDARENYTSLLRSMGQNEETTLLEPD